MKQWIFEFLKRDSDRGATVLAVTCWYVWEARNDTRNNEVQLHPLRVASKVVAYVEMIMNSCFKTNVPNSASATRDATNTMVPRWIPPPAGWICVNVDAALFPAERRMGWGAVFRDHKGAFILSCSEGFTGFPTPEMAGNGR
jgi:hypothetical protein